MGARGGQELSTDQTFVGLLMGLVLLVSIYYAFEFDLTLPTLLALAGAAVGLYFVQRSRAVLAGPAAGSASALQSLVYVYVAAWVLSWLAILIDRGFFLTVEILGVGVALVGAYLMLRIVAEARRAGG